jgi:exonuclease SbcC
MSQINRIQLENWKIHRKLNIKFKKGLNFIVGENGSGKTSIIEAILFGLTGKTLHSNRASFKNISTRSPANVNISFSNNENDFEISRTFNGMVYHKLRLITENEVIDKYTEINKKIEEIFNSRIRFLEQMIYYGENEYFKSFQSSHKHKFRNYIENFMGIKYLEDIRAKTHETSSHLKNDMKEFYIKLEGLSVKDEINYDKLKVNLRRRESEMEELKQENAYFSNKLKELNKEIKEIKTQIDNFNKLKGEMSSVLNVENLTDFNAIIDSIERKKKEINLEIKKNTSKTDEIKSEIAAFYREERIYKLINDTIREILRTNKNFDYCPLCKTDFKETNFNKILEKRSEEVVQDIKKNIHIKNTVFELNNKDKFLKKEMRELDNIREMLSLNKIYFEDLSKFDKLNQRNESFLMERNKIEKEYRAILIKMDDLNTKILDIKSKLKTLEKIDIGLDKNLVNYRIKRFNNLINLNRIIEESLEKTLYELRLKFLNPIMREITHIWNHIFKNLNCKVSFDDNLNPIIKKDSGEIDFKNLSGGEKTVLLILSRSLILHNFSRASFLLLDEPLEHLDVENRRLIIKYLENFCKSGLIDQLIITTFEETLTRRLKTESEVNLIYL